MAWKIMDKSRKVLRSWNESLTTIGAARLFRTMVIFIIGIVASAFTFGPFGPEWISFTFWQHGAVGK